jgi:hypothetical protein
MRSSMWARAPVTDQRRERAPSTLQTGRIHSAKGIEISVRLFANAFKPRASVAAAP